MSKRILQVGRVYPQKVMDEPIVVSGGTCAVWAALRPHVEDALKESGMPRGSG